MGNTVVRFYISYNTYFLGQLSASNTANELNKLIN